MGTGRRAPTLRDRVEPANAVSPRTDTGEPNLIGFGTTYSSDVHGLRVAGNVFSLRPLSQG